LPKPTRLAEWTVPTDEIDHLDHMSTVFYAWRADQAALQLVEALTGGALDPPAEGLTLAVVDRHTHFRREQRLGAPMAIAGGVTSAAGSRIGVYLEMSNAASGDLAATFNLQVELQARPSRAPVRVPQAWIAAAMSRRIEPPQRSHPRTLSAGKIGERLRPQDFGRAGVANHVRRAVTENECGPDGFLATARPQLQPVEDHPRTGVMADVWNSCPGYFWPAIEQRALKLRAVRCGDVLESYEALLSVHAKAMHSAVWTFEAASGALVEIRHQVNVFFNARSRRAEAMPAKVRDRLNGLVSPDLVSLHAIGQEGATPSDNVRAHSGAFRQPTNV
jgi:acyl-CoA thioesterase FadM